MPSYSSYGLFGSLPHDDYATVTFHWKKGIELCEMANILNGRSHISLIFSLTSCKYQVLVRLEKRLILVINLNLSNDLYFIVSDTYTRSHFYCSLLMLFYILLILLPFFFSFLNRSYFIYYFCNLSTSFRVRLTVSYLSSDGPYLSL